MKPDPAVACPFGGTVSAKEEGRGRGDRLLQPGVLPARSGRFRPHVVLPWPTGVIAKSPLDRPLLGA